MTGLDPTSPPAQHILQSEYLPIIPTLCPLPPIDRFAPEPLSSLPSWRIQQHYKNKVLVGNWAEERLKFTKGTCIGTTTYRADYQPYPSAVLDIREKLAIQKRHQGVPISILFSHHNIPRSWYLVAQYDEHLNRRANPCLPPLRKWNMRKLGWLPERSDYPIIAPPTNFGLLEEKVAKLNKRRQHKHSIYSSIYTISYGPDSLIPREPISNQQ
ncbi:cilia- and flagella-associated protein 107 [Heptranchias perlo]|uniref:cilia- and flagella-associated protein 107 n=1 Tax=Heptranchias perlo TaxID=212740 RepID=UPI003559B540